MIEIAKALGLAEDAAEADILAAITALKQIITDSESAALNAEAEAAADKNAPLIANRAQFVEAFILNKEVALKFIGSVKVPEEKKDLICNKAAAKTPTVEKPVDETTILNTFKGMKPGAEKDHYLVLNKAVLSKLMR